MTLVVLEFFFWGGGVQVEDGYPLMILEPKVLNALFLQSFSAPPPSVTVEGLFVVGFRLRSNLSIYWGYALKHEHIYSSFLLGFVAG